MSVGDELSDALGELTEYELALEPQPDAYYCVEHDRRLPCRRCLMADVPVPPPNPLLASSIDDLTVRQQEPCSHADTWFDRSICPEPCGSMHERCNDCGETLAHCRIEEDQL